MKQSTPNTTSYSLDKKSLPGQSGPSTQYSSKAVLGKVGTSGERRAAQYKLENLKK